MSQQKQENVEAFKAKTIDLEKRIVEVDAENQKLRQTLEEASKTLKVYVDREKEATIKAIKSSKPLRRLAKTLKRAQCFRSWASVEAHAKLFTVWRTRLRNGQPWLAGIL